MRKLFILAITLAGLQTWSVAQTNTFPASGNVGIGILSPTAKLHVYYDYGYGNSGDLLLFGGKGSWNLNDWEGMRLGFTQFRSVYEGSSHWGLGIRTGTSDGIGNEAMRISGNGNVGIGTITPNSPLQVLATNTISANTRYLTAHIGGAGSWGVGGYEELGIGYNGIRSIYTSNDNWDLAFSAGTSGNWVSGTQSERLRITSSGNVGIGTTNPDSKLTVAGKIHSQEVKVSINAGADFVFRDSYQLEKLEKLERFIKENKHLPEISSAEEMKKNGLDLGDMNIKLLQKIEELTLYLIEQNKRSEDHERWRKEQEKKIKEQGERIERQQQQINQLKSNL